MGLQRLTQPKHPRPIFLDDGLVLDAFQERPRLTLVLTSEPSVGEWVAWMCLQQGCEETRVLDAATLDGLAEELAPAHRRVGLAILCDESQHQPWFRIVRVAPAVFGGASLVLPTGDPYLCPRDLFWYSQTWGALLQFSEHATVSSTRLRL